MRKQKLKGGKKQPKPKNSPPNEMSLKPGRETVVSYQDLPSRPQSDKRIHPRREMPLVPEVPAADAGKGSGQGRSERKDE